MSGNLASPVYVSKVQPLELGRKIYIDDICIPCSKTVEGIQSIESRLAECSGVDLMRPGDRKPFFLRCAKID